MGLLRNLPCFGSNGGSSITASETGLSLTVFLNLSMHATMFAPNFSAVLSTNSLCSGSGLATRISRTDPPAVPSVTVRVMMIRGALGVGSVMPIVK